MKRLPAIGGEADAADGFVKVEMIKDSSGDETDQQRCSFCVTQTQTHIWILFYLCILQQGANSCFFLYHT